MYGVPGLNTVEKNKCLISSDEEADQGVPVVLLNVPRRKDERDYSGGELRWNHGPVVRPVGHAAFSMSRIASRHMSNRVVRERKEGTERSAGGECVGFNECRAPVQVLVPSKVPLCHFLFRVANICSRCQKIKTDADT